MKGRADRRDPPIPGQSGHFGREEGGDSGGAHHAVRVEDVLARRALVGDWNIAPENDDVWDMAVFSHSTHVSPPERAAFRAVVEAGYADVVRPHTPGPGVYTYWDYTKLRFPRREGMRIDFVLGSPALTRRVSGARIDREERKGKGASDHAPVIVELTD